MLNSGSFRLRADWRKSDRSVDGESHDRGIGGGIQNPET